MPLILSVGSAIVPDFTALVSRVFSTCMKIEISCKRLQNLLNFGIYIFTYLHIYIAQVPEETDLRNLTIFNGSSYITLANKSTPCTRVGQALRVPEG